MTVSIKEMASLALKTTANHSQPLHQGVRESSSGCKAWTRLPLPLLSCWFSPSLRLPTSPGWLASLCSYTQPYLLRESILAGGKGGKDHVLGVPVNPATHKKVHLIRTQLCAGRSWNQMCDKSTHLQSSSLPNMGLHINTCMYLAVIRFHLLIIVFFSSDQKKEKYNYVIL